MNQHFVCIFTLTAGAGKTLPSLMMVVMYCVCNSVFSFTLDQHSFPVHADEAYFFDVYASILLFHEKLAGCLRKPGMISNGCL